MAIPAYTIATIPWYNSRTTIRLNQLPIPKWLGVGAILLPARGVGDFDRNSYTSEGATARSLHGSNCDLEPRPGITAKWIKSPNYQPRVGSHPLRALSMAQGTKGP